MEKHKILKSFLLAAAAGGIALSAHAQVLVNEDFESGNMDNWSGWTPANVEFRSDSGPSGGGSTHLFYNPGTTAFVAGTNAIWGTSFSVTPTDDNPLVLQADLWFNGNNNQRNTVGIRTGTVILEVGFFNSGNNGLGARFNEFAGAESWVQAISYVDLGVGVDSNPRWISTTTTITSTTATVVFTDSIAEVDGGFGTLALNSSGDTPVGAFTELRIGGPSGVGSAGGGAGYDNIRLEVIPEPSTYAAIFGGLALVGAFVYRRRLSAKK